MQWVKHSHYIMKDRLLGLLKDTEKCVNIASADSNTLSIVAVDIPTKECVINRKHVSNFSMDGLIQQSSKISSISIPRKYLENSVIVQDAITDPRDVWVIGNNAIVSGDYVDLYTRSDYEPEALADTIQGELTPVYRLYTWNISNNLTYTDNFGVLCGFDLDKYPNHVRQALWESYTKGVSEKTVNVALSFTVSNDVCSSDSVVVDIWHESTNWYILCSDDSVYSGLGYPKVSIGDSVRNGDLLFTGIYTFNNSIIPSQNDVPYMIVRAGDSPLYAVNAEIPALPGYIGTVPDMGNKSWYMSVIDGQRRGVLPKLSDDLVINPLKYVLTSMIPGAVSLYTIKGMPYNEASINDITEMFNLTYPTCSTGLFKCITPDNTEMTIDEALPTVSVAVSLESEELSPTFYCKSHNFI